MKIGFMVKLVRESLDFSFFLEMQFMKAFEGFYSNKIIYFGFFYVYLVMEVFLF